MKFTEINFSEKVLEGIQKAGFTECMPVQSEVFLHALEAQQDVTVQSRTGTGKTAAFLLTIFELFSRNPDAQHKALIIAPTRELAVQIEQEAKLLGSHLPYKIGSFYGGVGYKTQDQLLKEGVDIIIGTPGRLLDYAQSKKLKLDSVDILVIDEADRLFDMGFLPDLKKMLRQMVKPQERQTMLFSATLGTRVAHLAWDFMNEAKEIVIDNDRVTVDEITQELYHTSNNEKFPLLLGLLQREKPSNAIIFSNTKDMAVKLAKRLSLNGYQAEYIMGDLPQRKRQSIINRIKEAKLEILVATDVAARGLHINDLDLVMNFDLPEDPENYVHRIGRTARAGKSGKAISLACEKFVYGLEAIQEFIDMKIPVEWADESLLSVEDKSKGMRISGTQTDRQTARSSRSSRSSGPSRRSGSSSKGSGRGPSRSASRDSSRGGSRPSPQKAHTPKANRPAQPAKASQPAKAAQSTRPAQPSKAAHPAKAAPAQPAKSDDLESRLEYYRKKYGENFELTDSTQNNGSAGTRKAGTKKSGGRKGNSRNNTPRKGRSAKPSDGGATQVSRQGSTQDSMKGGAEAKKPQPAAEKKPEQQQGIFKRLFNKIKS